MNKYKDGIEVQPMSRQAIRDFTKTLRSYMGVSDNQKFPVMKFLEFVTPKIYEDFNYEILSKEEMKNKHGETYPNKRIIHLRQDVYEGACNGNGRDLYTVAHEIGHFFMHAGDYSFARRAHEEFPVYENSEWQADVFAAELLMPYTEIKNMRPADVSRIYGVSPTAAQVQCRIVNK